MPRPISPRPDTPPTRTLRERPDLDQLKRQAKELLAAFLAGDADAVAEVRARYRDADAATLKLHDAQLVLARSHGFESWPKLKAYVDGITVKRLADAVRAGDVARVRAMLAVRPELVHMDVAGSDEHRALHYAVLDRAPAMVRLLTQHGADARKGIYPHRDATSALTFAVERGYDDIAAIILDEERHRQAHAPATGSQADAASVMADPEALFDAIAWGDPERTVAMFEANPALIHASHPNGWTALHVAAATLNERMVVWLLEHGADVNRRVKDDWTPLAVAASGRGWGKRGNPERFAVVARVLRRRGAELTSVSAVALGDADWVRARHAEGALVNATHLDVWGPFGGLLTIAVLHDRAEMLALLLDLGFDPDERVRVDGLEEAIFSWGAPLHVCAGAGKAAMAQILLDRGADPNGEVFTSGTPVGSAYGARDWAMVQRLERHGGIVYAANAGYYRDTALAKRLFAEEAAGALRKGVVAEGQALAEVLLDSGASGGDPEIVRMALARIDWPRDDPRWIGMLGAPLSFWNHIAGIPSANPGFDRSTYLTCFRLVLERCDPNLRPERFGETALHDVAAMGDNVTGAEVAAFAAALLDAGARVDVRDDLLESTPLGWACRWGRAEMVALLLERGADPVEADAKPWATPRAWAEKRGHAAVLELLREDGC